MNRCANKADKKIIKVVISAKTYKIFNLFLLKLYI